MIGRNQIKNPWWLIVIDFLLMLFSLYLVLRVRFESMDQNFINLNYRIFIPLFLIWLVILFIHNLFDFRILRSYLTLVINLISAMFFNLVIAAVYFYFQPGLLLTPRRTLLLVSAISFLLLLAWRIIIKQVVKRRITDNYYLLSSNGELSEIENAINQHHFLGLRVIKHLTDVTELEALPDQNYSLIVSKKLLSDQEVLKKIYKLRLKGVDFYGSTEFYEHLLHRVPLADLEELWLVKNVGFKQTLAGSLARRLIDLLVGLFLMAGFIITFPFIALLLKINSPGPLFFVQSRVGKNGTSFQVYKYRTMSQDSSGKGWTEANDSRITKAGKILRRLHLDELPQFINLLAGNMTLVGPRPEQEEIVAQMRKLIPFYDERHLVKPGLTGWAQLHIYAGSLEETRRKLEYDLYYMKHRSLLFDLEIILKTLYFVITAKS